ncbi:MAG TPA: ATP-binding protein [Candidatus Babeliales bacterium]|nr:ATP-binding protein [Candidatus Babeliales bacterium]
MNQLKLITLVILSSYLLAAQEKQQTPINKTVDFNISPLYLPDPEYFQQNTAKESIIQKNQIIDKTPLPRPARWIVESAMENAPKLVKGIFTYLQLRSCCSIATQSIINIPSFHRFILVGPPGSGKTTLAYAIAEMLGYTYTFIPAADLLGKFRNETAINLQKIIQKCISDGGKRVIIIDELHKLFEHHKMEQTDHSQTAASFWLILDHIEKFFPNIIIIGTANNVDKLPPEIKSRFTGKIIHIQAPDKNQKIQIFKNSIIHDQSMELDPSITDAFIAKIIQQMEQQSLRDIRLFIDSAKIFYYAEQTISHSKLPIVLTKIHFQQALNQLQAESQALKESFSDQLCKKLQPWGVVFAIAVNIITLIKASHELTCKTKFLIKKYSH